MCLVDVFDLQGSLLSNLKDIAGENPIVIAANKIDLIPTDASKNRITSWLYEEIRKQCQLVSPRDLEDQKYRAFEARGWIRPKERETQAGVLYRSNIHLISCVNGTGINDLLTSIFAMAKDNGNKIYVMGAANVGKSSFINRLVNYKAQKKGSAAKNKQLSKTDLKLSANPHVTVSNLPGTTLNFLKIKLPNGITVVDTPGLINKGNIR